MSIILESLICCLSVFACFCTICRVRTNANEEYLDTTTYSTNTSYTRSKKTNFSYLYPDYSTDYSSDNSPLLVGIDLSESDIECSICLERYILNQEIHMLLCGHFYHSNCYKNWSAKGKLSLAEERCPFCRTIINK
jgi:hypothetical protein